MTSAMKSKKGYIQPVNWIYNDIYWQKETHRVKPKIQTNPEDW